MPEFRATLNFRVDHDMNVSLTLVRVVDTEEEANEAGRHDARLITAYTAGYTVGAAEGVE